MKKESSKIVETKVKLPDVMKKYGAYFSLELSEGFAHVKIEDNGKIFVEWLNDEGYMKEGDLVLDNCAGSGTTGVACKNLNRNCILMEKEKEYIDIIHKRLNI